MISAPGHDPSEKDNEEQKQEIIKIELITGDRAEALMQFCREHIGLGGEMESVGLETLRPLPAPPDVQRQYWEGIFKIVELIKDTGRVEMGRELYDMFQQCAKIQGTELEKILAIIIFQEKEGKRIVIENLLK